MMLTGFKNTTSRNQEEKLNINISHKNIAGLIYAVIKANELEIYKEAGYIVKVLTSNLKSESLMKSIVEIHDSTYQKRNISYDTGIDKVNDFSFEYCLNKTIVLFVAQYVFKGEFFSISKHQNLFNIIDYEYLFKKLIETSKDYKMVSLEEDTFESFKTIIERNHGIPVNT